MEENSLGTIIQGAPDIIHVLPEETITSIIVVVDGKTYEMTAPIFFEMVKEYWEE